MTHFADPEELWLFATEKLAEEFGREPTLAEIEEEYTELCGEITDQVYEQNRD